MSEVFSFNELLTILIDFEIKFLQKGLHLNQFLSKSIANISFSFSLISRLDFFNY